MPSIQADRRLSLLVRARHRLALSQATVKPDHEAPCRVVMDRTTHPHDTVDMGSERVRLRVTIASVENHQLDRGASRTEGLLQRRRRYELSPAIGPLEEQAVWMFSLMKAEPAHGILMSSLYRGSVAGHVLSAMAAEVNHRWLELAKLTEQVERLCSPPGHEFEAMPVTTALELHLNRTCLATECELVGSGRICSQE